MIRYYAPDGTPITLEEWAGSREGDDSVWQQHKQYTEATPSASVSTVWLGMDHSWGEGPPLIFESMIFGGNLDQEQVRYSTAEQAREGHERLVSLAVKEAEDFASLAAEPAVRDCVAYIERVLTEHRGKYELSEYGDLYTALVNVIGAPTAADRAAK